MSKLDRHQSWFTSFAKKTSHFAGRPIAFSIAAGAIILWSVCGPLFQFSDTWQLVINTSTTIVTFLMVFLIQNTQNRDSEAMQIKLDELLRVTDKANAALLDLEELDDEELDATREQYEKLAREARNELRKRRGHEAR
jgi:low affinity Fe/Cu permease